MMEKSNTDSDVLSQLSRCVKEIEEAELQIDQVDTFVNKVSAKQKKLTTSHLDQ